MSGVIVLLRKLVVQVIRKFFNAMREEEDETESHLSISSSNVCANEENFYVSSDTSSEDEIMILDAGVQTSFKSEDDSHFDDDNDLLNKEMPEEVIYLNIDTIEVNYENIDEKFFD